MSCSWTAGAKGGHYAKKNHWLQLILSFKRLRSWTKLFPFSFPSYVTFGKGGPESMPVEHWIAAVNQSRQQCLTRKLYHLCLYPCLCVSVQGQWVLRSNANESYPNLQLSVNRSRCFISKSISTLSQLNSCIINAYINFIGRFSTKSFGWQITQGTLFDSTNFI